MNYDFHYESIISRAKLRDSKSLCYYETHHIKPKSEGGTDEIGNLVKLTAREHFLAHWLLYRMDPTIKSRAFSFWRMCRGKGACPDEEWPTISSRCYEEARQAHSKAISEALSGVKKSPEHVKKVALAVKGKKRTEEQKQKLRKPHRVSEEGKKILAQNGRKSVEKRKKKVVMLDKETLQYIKEFNSLLEAANFTNLSGSNICIALKNGSIAGNYRWKYKDQVDYVKKPDRRENSKQNFIGDRNPNKSEYARKKISERFTGSKNHNAKKVIQLDLEGNVIKLWDYMTQAAKSLSIHQTNIQKCCSGKRNQTGGYRWSYA